MELLTAKQIREITFEPAKRGHYDDDDVDDFVDQCAYTVDTLQAKIDELNSKLEVLADKLMEYRNEEDSIRTALLNAQRMGDSIVREAKQKSELMLDDARIKAEKIHEIARREISDEELELQRLRQEVSAFKNQMLDMYRKHLSLIDLLPEEEPASVEVEPEAVAEEQESVLTEEVAPVEEPVVEETVAEEPAAAEPAVEEAAIEEANAVADNVQEQEAEESAEEEVPLLDSLWKPEDDLLQEEQNLGEEEVPVSRFGNLKFGKDYEVNGPFRRRK